MEDFKCSNCKRQYPSFIKLELNNKILCPNCILEYIVFNENELLKENILTDENYTYTLSKELLVNLIRVNLTKEQFFILNKKYPNSFYLHDDFYDENGVAMQPKI